MLKAPVELEPDAAPGDWRGPSRAISAVAADPAGTIDAWRPNLPAVRTMDDVAREYSALYSR